MVDNAERKIPNTFAETVRLVERYALEQIASETVNKQLYYHTVAHALAVKRRANFIFGAIEPVLKEERKSLDYSRLNNLLELCAIAHDMVQNFIESSQLHTSRKRPVGVSETKTIAKLIKYIQDLDRKLSTWKVPNSVRFTSSDLETIQESISATICERDPLAGKTDYSFSEYSIYQPYLYNSIDNNSIVAQIIALADLGTLGIDGIESYLQEGVLILLEDNPDLVRLILNRELADLTNDLEQVTKFRLVEMTRFMVNFAKERYSRFPREIAGFSTRAQDILRHRVFKHLTLENVRQIERLTPTKTDTSLTELLSFFSEKLEKTSLDPFRNL
ncbi:hypothetical protein [Myxosarcina sp. GI1(2024)]